MSTTRRALGVLGEVLITAGVVVGLFAVYTLFWTGVETGQQQDALADELAAQERPGVVGGAKADRRPPKEGQAYLRMRIPRLGDDWEWVVVEGISVEDLQRGPGHYPTSAAVGEIGNFAVAGHRATYGEPFAFLDLVVPGDTVVFERKSTRWTYEITDSFLTTPDDVAVLLPVPRRPAAEPTEAILTLTTCHPRWGSTERLIKHGILVEQERLPQGRDGDA
jgi:sortase A